MKLPYRAGDSFALPLGDGSHVRAQIVARNHHTVDIAVNDLEPIRASDRALVLHRWRLIANEPIARSGAPAQAYWTGPARVERLVATQLGVAPLQLHPLTVHEGRFTRSYACARSDDDLRALARRGVTALIVAGPVNLGGIAALFPELRALRIAVRDFEVDARVLAACVRLQVLDLSGVSLTNIDALAALGDLRAIRFARMRRFDLREIADLRAEAISLESIADVHGISALTKRSNLLQVELLDLWPCALEEVMPLVESPQLVRAYVDIGGRRKNVELYRRAQWAYPWPLECYLQLA